MGDRKNYGMGLLMAAPVAPAGACLQVEMADIEETMPWLLDDR